MRAESEAVRSEAVADEAASGDVAADIAAPRRSTAADPTTAVPLAVLREPAPREPAPREPAHREPALRAPALREPAPPMTDDCPELPRIHALADGELPAREAALARDHLADCEECRAELDFLMQLALAVARGVAPIDEMDAFSAMAVLGAVRAIGPPS